MLVLDPIGTRWGVEPVFTPIARLLVDVLGVARHRRHGDLLRVVDDEGGGARRRRPVLRPVRVAARRLLGEHVEKLLGGRCNATQSLNEHQPRYGFLDPLRVVVLRPRPLPACILLDPSVSIRMSKKEFGRQCREDSVQLSVRLLVKKEKKENRQPKGGMGGRYTATTQGF